MSESNAPKGLKMYFIKNNGQKTRMVKKRERWVKYLTSHKLRTDEIYNKEIILNMTQSVKEKIQMSNSNNTKGDMNLKIITMITRPTKKCKLKGEKYLVRERK